jgi:DNA-binding GntR family transcriptional regulator
MLSTTNAIQRTHLHDEVLSKLRAMILRGELAPGERVQERALCEELGISRTPLREALKVLAASGLVELWPSRGARIAPLRADEVAQTFDVIAVLEREAGGLAAVRLDAARIDELCRLHEAMLAHARVHDSESLLRLDLQIHRTLVEVAGNRMLAAVHEGLAIRVERARFIVSTDPERLRRSMQEHEVILEAILARDPARVADALHDHCLRTRDAIVAAIRSQAMEGSKAVLAG